MPHAQSPHRSSSGDAYAAFDILQSSKEHISAPNLLRTQSPLLSQSTSLSVDAPSLDTAVGESAPSSVGQVSQPKMNVEEQQRMQWAAPPSFFLNPAGHDRAGYQVSNNFSSVPGDYYHYAQNGMSYDANYNLTYPTQYCGSSCPRSYNGIDLTGLPNDLAIADSFPPTAYHIEPPKHHDAMDLSDQEISGQLMQLTNEYEHPQHSSYIKVEDHHGYQSPYSNPARASTSHENPLHPQEFDGGEVGAVDKEQPYAQLIYQALLNAPGNTMILRDIYDWFKNNTDKASASETKGWQNSIRHNLSMNGAFEKVDQPGEETRKGFMWRLTDQAIREGVKSTTRYRCKAPNKRGQRTHLPQPQRQASGAKGGQAARRTARLKRSARLHDAQRNMQQISRSVPAAFDPSYHRHALPPTSSHSHPPSPYYSSDRNFSYGSQNVEFPNSPLRADHHSQIDLFSSAAAWSHTTGSPMSQGLPIADTAYLLDHSPTESLFTNSPSPSADEPRTPMDTAGGWQEDVAMGPECVFDEQIAYREYAE